MKKWTPVSDNNVTNLTLLETNHQPESLVNAKIIWQLSGTGKKHRG